MYKTGTLVFIHGQSSLHAGSGAVANYIDLPIQREKHTNYPHIESSGIKGAYRHAVEIHLGPVANNENKHSEFKVAFGSDVNTDTSSALGFSDASLLFFPVKSMKGTMAWITCPRVLNLFLRNCALLGPITFKNNDWKLEIDEIISSENIVFSSDKEIKNVVLEEYRFKQQNFNKEDTLISQLSALLFQDAYWVNYFKERVAIVHDDVFQLITELHTEVVTRNKINDLTGVAEDGHLFVEESLPPETILYFNVFAAPEYSKDSDRMSAQDVLTNFTTWMKSIPYLQIGGDATIGSGICRNIIVKVQPTTVESK